LIVYIFWIVLVLFLLFFLGGKLFWGQDTRVEAGKVFIYECGFQDLNDQVDTYTIQFFLIRVSFMLFDLEIILIIPLVGLYNVVGLVLLFIFFLLFAVSLALRYELFLIF